MKRELDKTVIVFSFKPPVAKLCNYNITRCLNSASASFRGHIWRPITSARRVKAVPIWRLLQMLLLLPVSGGCTATIHRGLTYPKILCAPEKEERKRENGDGRNRHNQEMLQRLDRPIYQQWTRLTRSVKDSPSKTAKAESFRGCRPWTETRQLRLTMTFPQKLTLLNKHL